LNGQTTVLNNGWNDADCQAEQSVTPYNLGQNPDSGPGYEQGPEIRCHDYRSSPYQAGKYIAKIRIVNNKVKTGNDCGKGCDVSLNMYYPTLRITCCAVRK
jgi:hypothetical protein